MIRSVGFGFSICCVLVAAQASASASFANKNLGIGIGYTKFLGDVAAVQGVLTDWAIPVTLNAGYYIEGGFEAYIRVGGLFMYQRTGLGTDMNGSGILVGLGGNIGIRYLFLEESIRPYVGLHLAGFGIGKPVAGNETPPPATIMGGVGTTAGVDFFVGESVSLGVQGTVDLYLTLVPVVARFTAGGGGYVTIYF